MFSEKINEMVMNKVVKSRLKELYRRQGINSKDMENMKLETVLEKIDALIKEGQKDLEKKIKESETKFENLSMTHTGLLKKYEDLKEENKGYKNSMESINNVVNDVSKQNEILKDTLKRYTSENNRINDENKIYKENSKELISENNNLKLENSYLKTENVNLKDKLIEAEVDKKILTKKLETKIPSVIKHNFTRKEETKEESKQKGISISR